MLGRVPKRKRQRTIAGDKNYDTKGFVADARAAGFTPHVARNNPRRRSAIDGRTARHAGYVASQRTRKRVEEPFVRIKTIAGGHELRNKGPHRNWAWFLIAAATYNLVRIAKIDTQTAWTNPEPATPPNFSTLLDGNGTGVGGRTRPRLSCALPD